MAQRWIRPREASGPAQSKNPPGPEVTSGNEVAQFSRHYAEIDRAISVELKRRRSREKPSDRSRGTLARALQHEVDHLNGILFIDRMSSSRRRSLASRLKRLRRRRAGLALRAPLPLKSPYRRP